MGRVRKVLPGVAVTARDAGVELPLMRTTDLVLLDAAYQPCMR
jgi:hypothetical protein